MLLQSRNEQAAGSNFSCSGALLWAQCSRGFLRFSGSLSLDGVGGCGWPSVSGLHPPPHTVLPDLTHSQCSQNPRCPPWDWHLPSEQVLQGKKCLDAQHRGSLESQVLPPWPPACCRPRPSSVALPFPQTGWPQTHSLLPAQWGSGVGRVEMGSPSEGVCLGQLRCFSSRPLSFPTRGGLSKTSSQHQLRSDRPTLPAEATTFSVQHPHHPAHPLLGL